MITEDQTAVIELLGSSSTHGGVPVERIDTHTAVVFLAGARAWKLKRAVKQVSHPKFYLFDTGAARQLGGAAHLPVHPELAPPYVIAVVTLDEGPRLSTNIVDGVTGIGDRVRVVWRDREDAPPYPVFVPAPE